MTRCLPPAIRRNASAVPPAIRRGAIALALALAIAGGVAGCGGGDAKNKGERPIQLALDFTPNAAHAPLYAAVRTGADRRHGLRLRILGPGTGTPDSLKLVRSGRADVGVLDIHDLGLAAERGADVVGIAALVQRPLAAVIARDRIERPRDLAGRTVGVTGLPSDVAVLKAVVAGDEGDFDSIKQVTIGFAAVPQMVEGTVDAVTAFWNAEGTLLRQRGVPIREFRVERFGAPPYPEVILFTTRERLDERREDIEALVAAIGDGVKAVEEDPAAAITDIARASRADRPLVRAQLDAVRPLFQPPMRLDPSVLREWAAWDARVGILPRRPNVGRLFDTTVAP
jgi:NitT/TauT family transport system substrate-binding protein/putative hydroxymethylpyrimidine transport system substrate-binding protein